MRNLASRCRICGKPLLTLEARKRRVGSECWSRLTPAQQAKALALAAREADPHYIPPTRRPSAVALANRAAVRAAVQAPTQEAVCDRHGGVVGRCAQCRREADPHQAAARIIWEIQQERAAAREQAWRDRVDQLLAVADG